MGKATKNYLIVLFHKAVETSYEKVVITHPIKENK